MLATQSECCSSCMKPHSMSLWTSISIASIMSGRKRRYCCFTGLMSGLVFNRCMAICDQNRAYFITPCKDIDILSYKSYQSSLSVSDKLSLIEIDLNYPILSWRLMLFKSLLPLEIKLLSPWLSVKHFNILFMFQLIN